MDRPRRTVVNTAHTSRPDAPPDAGGKPPRAYYDYAARPNLSSSSTFSLSKVTAILAHV